MSLTLTKDTFSSPSRNITNSQTTVVNNSNSDFFSSLPEEIFCNILSYLNQKEKQSDCLVCKSWNVEIIITVRLEEETKLNNFRTFVIDKINNLYSNQKNTLINLLSNTTLSNSKNLLEVKSANLSLRKILLIVLKTLKDNDLEKLEKLSIDIIKPIFFGKIFALAIIENKLAQINTAYAKPGASSTYVEESDQPRKEALSKIAIDLANIEEFDNAIEVAHLANDPFHHSYNFTFSKLASALAEMGKIDLALKVIQKSNYSLENVNICLTLNNISKIVAQGGDIHTAKKVAEMIRLGWVKLIADGIITNIQKKKE